MRRRLADETSPGDAKEFWTATKILMGLRFAEDTITTLLHGVVNMQESVTYQSIKREGLVEGLAEGEAKGELRALILLGTRRFGEPDAAILGRLRSIKDLTTLDRISLGLFAATSWAELVDLGN